MYFHSLLLAATASAIALPPSDINLESLLIQNKDTQKGFADASHHIEPSNAPSTYDDDDDDDPLPVILWHGLGDSSNADGLQDVADLIASIHPGTYVHLISANGKPDDRSASFFGNVTEQLETVCETLANDPILRTAPAVDAIGFSQGGQFLRGYIERCNTPKVRSLITFGSQHNGISEFQKCKSPSDWICHAANAILKGSTVWSDYVQRTFVPAQYFRDPADYDNYLEHSGFLADINNERENKNTKYKENLSKLDNFVMVLFKDDLTVIPKESSWFASKNETTGNVTKLQDRTIYKEDWIGLKELDKKGALVFETVDGEHMQLNDKDLKRLFEKYLGPAETKGQKLKETPSNYYEQMLDLSNSGSKRNWIYR